MYWYALKSNMIVLLLIHQYKYVYIYIIYRSHYCLITYPSKKQYIYIYMLYKIKDGYIILCHPSILYIYIYLKKTHIYIYIYLPLSSLLEHIHLTQRLCDRNCFEPRAQVVRVRGHSTILGGQRLCFGVWTTERYPLVMSK